MSSTNLARILHQRPVQHERLSNDSSVSKSDHLNSLEISTNDDIFYRKIRGLLNKITRGSFTSISTQFLTLVNGPEINAQAVLRVVQLIYEHGIDDVAFSGIYARLCRTMMEQINPDITDNSLDKPLAGGQLFRKYLLDYCQEQFERLWNTSEAALTPRDRTRAAGEERLFSEEYYAAQKFQRQRRGIIRFVGELYKLQMLTDKVVHDCIMKFLKDDAPGEQNIESLCMLLSVAGQTLEAQVPLYLNAYFERIGNLAMTEAVSFRTRSMLMVC